MPAKPAVVPLSSETLFRKVGRRYVPVAETVYTRTLGDRFPRGRWVMVVEPGRSCCLHGLPDADDALLAALHAFRWVLEEELVKATEIQKDDRSGLTDDEWRRVKAIMGERQLWATRPAVGTAVLAAVEAFAKRVAGKKP